jgi:hypothetical protein
MVNLGVFYQIGRGVPTDSGEAMRWFRRAADLGLTAAMNNFAILYTAGRGVPANHAEAMRWYRRAADIGSANAMNHISHHFGMLAPVFRNERFAWKAALANVKGG